MALLSAAFVAEALPYDPSWAATYSNDPDDLSGFLRFEAVAKRQIVDLREMREAGILDGKWIGLGVSAPRGRQWYNFDPHQYLECAAAGSIGGWEPGDGTGRDFVPGPVAALDANGQVTSADPREVERPIYAVPRVSWERFSDFLICGQIYE